MKAAPEPGCGCNNEQGESVDFLIIYENRADPKLQLKKHPSTPAMQELLKQSYEHTQMPNIYISQEVLTVTQNHLRNF